MKKIIPDDIDPYDWHMQELEKLRPVIDFIIDHTMPELVQSVFYRMQLITKHFDIATSEDGSVSHSWWLHDVAMADTIGLIAERLGKRGIKPKMTHRMLKPLMEFMDNVEWKTIEVAFECWYESDLSKILPYLEKKLSVRTN